MMFLAKYSLGLLLVMACNSSKESAPPQAPVPQRAASCVDLPLIEFGKWDQSLPLLSGSTISATCDAGYVGSPAPSAQCDNGVWLHASGSCSQLVKKVCSSLPSLSNGQWDQSAPIASGSTISATCHVGYVGSPAPSAQCDNGAWVNLSGFCLDPRCPSSTLEEWDDKLNSCMLPTPVLNFSSDSECIKNGHDWSWDHSKGKCVYGGLKPIFLIFSGFIGSHAGRKEAAQKIFRSHKIYAQKHGYSYFVFDSFPLAGHDSMCVDSPGSQVRCLPYWGKVAQLKSFLEHVQGDQLWFVWLDDDMVPLAQSIALETILNDEPSKDLIITDDVGGPFDTQNRVNTGFFMINAKTVSHLLVDEWYKLRNRYDGSLYLGTCPNQSCLHEQRALTILYNDNSILGGKHIQDLIRIISQVGTTHVKGINRFERRTHTYLDRGGGLQSYNDRIESVCQPASDFLCQCTGMSANGYLPTETSAQARDLRSECLEQLVHSIKY